MACQLVRLPTASVSSFFPDGFGNLSHVLKPIAYNEEVEACSS
jgi:hypothetical protein